MTPAENPASPETCFKGESLKQCGDIKESLVGMKTPIVLCSVWVKTASLAGLRGINALKLAYMLLSCSCGLFPSTSFSLFWTCVCTMVISGKWIFSAGSEVPCSCTIFPLKQQCLFPWKALEEHKLCVQVSRQLAYWIKTAGHWFSGPLVWLFPSYCPFPPPQNGNAVLLGSACTQWRWMSSKVLGLGLLAWGCSWVVMGAVHPCTHACAVPQEVVLPWALQGQLK